MKFQTHELAQLSALCTKAGISTDAFWAHHGRAPIAKLSGANLGAISRSNQAGASAAEIDAAINEIAGYPIEIAVLDAARAISGGGRAA